MNWSELTAIATVVADVELLVIVRALRRQRRENYSAGYGQAVIDSGRAGRPRHNGVSG